MKNNIHIIDLGKYRGGGSTSFTGRFQGNAARKELKLDSIDQEYNKIEVKIPLNTTSFNPSFFLGLFFNSIKKLKSIEKFKEKFSFSFEEKENEEIKNIVKKNINEALFYAKGQLKDVENGYRLI